MVNEWHGAEAVSTKKEKKLIKHRAVKGYRHPALDKSLRQFRTRREAKVIAKLREAGIPVPEIFKHDDESMKIVMEYISGRQLKEVFHKNPKKYAKEIGVILGKLHAADIIHADLTTSNMIVHPKKGLYLIDFGLSFFSPKIEDKAVDLHVLDRALEAKHYKHYPDAIKIVLEHYRKTYHLAKPVLERLELVKKRGRHKQHEGS